MTYAVRHVWHLGTKSMTYVVRHVGHLVTVFNEENMTYVIRLVWHEGVNVNAAHETLIHFFIKAAS